MALDQPIDTNPSILPERSSPSTAAATWDRFMLADATLRWVGGVYLILLGLALLVLPPGPITSPVDSEIRGAITTVGGLVLLWLAALRLPRPAVIAATAVVVVPQFWFAIDFAQHGTYQGAATLGFLALAILASGFATDMPADRLASRPDALGLAFGAAAAVQGLIYLFDPKEAGPIPGAVGLSAEACGALLLGGGLAVTAAQLRPGYRSAWRVLAHLWGGGVILALWAAVALRYDAVYFYLGAASLVRGLALATLPWLGPRLDRFDSRSLAPRLALAFGTTAVVPLLLAFPLVLDKTVGRAGEPDVRQAAFGFSLLLMALSAAAAWWLAARLVAPVDAVVRAVEAVAAGGRDVAVPSGTVTELTRLSDAVSTMAATIAEREAALERRRREFETLVAHAPDIVTRFDRELRHLYVNQAVEAVTGMPPAAFLGKTNAELGMPADLVALWERHSRAALETGQEQNYEFSFQSPAGVRHFRARLVPEPGPDGRIETLLNVTYDVTAVRRAETERAALLDAVAHDLKNPLAAIKTQVQLLQRQLRRGTEIAPDALEERLGSIDRQVMRMSGLLDDLRADTVTISPERRNVDLAEVVSETVESALRVRPEHPIRLEAGEAPVVGAWDPQLLGRVVANLLDNAAKYSPNGNAIVVRVERDGDEAVLSVRDRGIGIPAADLPHVFEFRRRARNVGDVEGSGVGLASCKRLVDAHGGTIAVESSEGQGTVVTVRLPLAEG